MLSSCKFHGQRNCHKGKFCKTWSSSQERLRQQLPKRNTLKTNYTKEKYKTHWRGKSYYDTILHLFLVNSLPIKMLIIWVSSTAALWLCFWGLYTAIIKHHCCLGCCNRIINTCILHASLKFLVSAAAVCWFKE